MSERKWTASQAEAIDERDRTLLVSAAAGSGKTATLTERIIRTLTDPAASAELSRMLIVTFTRAAAAELRTRISSALSLAIASGGRTAHLSRQLLALPTAKISTIDSFCLDLVRANAVSLGLSPAFRLADAAENKLLLDSQMKRLVEDAYDGNCEGVAPDDFCALVDDLSDARGDTSVGEILLSFYDRASGFARSHGLFSDAVDALTAAKSADPFATPFGDEIRARTARELTPFRDRLSSLIRRVELDPLIGTKYPPVLVADLEATDKLLSHLPLGYEAMRSTFAAVEKKSIPAVRGVRESALAEEAKTAHAELHSRIGALHTKYYLYSTEAWQTLLSRLAEKTALIASLLSTFSSRVDEEKRRRSILSFPDLSRYAHDLLWDGNGELTPLARDLRGDFDYVYIDEYQDVNEIQHRIFEALSPPRGRFMVGDVKQSIYGFRGAQPEIFAALRAAFPPHAACGDSDSASLSLSANFRSAPPILDFVNAVFGRHMGGGLGAHIGYDADTDRLVPGIPREGVRVRVALFTDADYGEEKDGSQDCEDAPASPLSEEAFVAAEIARLLREGTKKADGTPLLPADIAILTRNTATAERFVAALEEAGIASECAAKRGFFLNPEILLALSLLNVIDNPLRDVYLAGLLRSPLFGFTMDELITLRREANADEDLRDCSLYEALVAYVKNHPDFSRGVSFLSDLARYRRMAEGRPVDALIWQLYRETGILSIAGADKEGDPAARRANLILLYDYARRFEASSYRGLYNFIAYINEAIERGQTIEEVRAQSERPDTVRVMTMHQSKGLEFPVTFVSDCGHGFNLKDAHAPVLFERDLALSLKLRDDSGYARLRNPIYNLLSERNVERAVEEELRILYVALTRAKERLYVTATVKSMAPIEKKICPADRLLDESASYACRSHIELILSAVGADSFYDLTVDGEGILIDTPEAPPETDASARACDLSLAETYQRTLRSRFNFLYPDAHLSRLPGKMSVSRLYPTALDGADEDAVLLPDAPGDITAAPECQTVPLFLGGERNTAARAGTATHLFMQFCDFTAVKESGVEDELSRLVEHQFIAKEDAALVRLHEVGAFLRSPLFEMLSSPDVRLYRELRFHARFPASAFTERADKKSLYEGETVLVQGVMDAVLITPTGEVWLIDYKTDRLSAVEKNDRKKAEEKLRTRHALQLSYYAAACRDIFGRLPDRVLIYSLALGDTVELPVSLPEGV